MDDNKPLFTQTQIDKANELRREITTLIDPESRRSHSLYGVAHVTQYDLNELYYALNTITMFQAYPFTTVSHKNQKAHDILQNAGIIYSDRGDSE